MSIAVSPYQACCGIRVLWNFGNDTHNNEIDIKEVEKELKITLKSGTRNPYGSDRNPLPKMAMLLIAVNEKQNKLMKKILIENGFKLVSQGWNAAHKNMNYLYSLEKKKSVKRKIKELIS